MEFHPRQQRRIIIVGVIIVVIGLATASEALHDRMADIIVWIEGIIARAPLAGMVAFVLLAMISAMLAFFSSAFLTPVAVYAWGTWACVALLWTGWLLGGIAAFAIGRLFGRRVTAVLVGEEPLARWTAQLGASTRFRHILLFQAVVPSEIPGYLLGTLNYRFPPYLLALAITEIPYAVAAVYLGESFLEGRSEIVIAAGVAVLLLAALMHVIGRRRASRGPGADGRR
jgi:uncharacterized membrane protein YdjX (TVP38/TMEM64 family)